MKVICTKDDDQNAHSLSGFVGINKALEFGKVYTVMYERASFINPKYRVYALAELTGVFWIGYFSPLNGPDEREISEKRVEQACAEVTALYEAIPQPEIAIA